MSDTEQFVFLIKGEDTELKTVELPPEGIPYAERILSIVESAEQERGIHFQRPIVIQGYFPKAYIPLGVDENGHLRISVALAMATEIDEKWLKSGLYHEMFHVEEEKRLKNEPYNFGAGYDTFLKNCDNALSEVKKVPIVLRDSWLNELKANAFSIHCLHGDIETSNNFIEFINNHVQDVIKKAADAEGKEPTKNQNKEKLYAPLEIDAAFRKIFAQSYQGAEPQPAPQKLQVDEQSSVSLFAEIYFKGNTAEEKIAFIREVIPGLNKENQDIIGQFILEINRDVQRGLHTAQQANSIETQQQLSQLQQQIGILSTEGSKKIKLSKEVWYPLNIESLEEKDGTDGGAEGPVDQDSQATQRKCASSVSGTHRQNIGPGWGKSCRA